MEVNLEVVETDAINIMKKAGQEFAEQQYGRHWMNEWKLDDEQRKERIEHWRQVKERIGQLCAEMKQARKAGA